MKQGQIQVTFNWIYVLIAGAVILLFFVGVVVKQKASSDQQLSQDIVEVMDSIFVGASVSEKTKNVVDISGLHDVTFYFDCEDGVTEYGIKEQSASVQDPTAPIFAPLELQGRQLITWSLPYKMPYKVVDLLMISSDNIKYVIISPEEEEDLKIELKEFKHGIVTDLEDIDPQEFFHIRVIDLLGNAVQENAEIPAALKGKSVSAVSFSNNKINFFIVRNDKWVLERSVPSLSPNSNDPLRYAAFFAGSGEEYECNLKKAFVRLQLMNEVYLAKAQQIMTFYRNAQESAVATNCLTGFDDQLFPLLGEYRDMIGRCINSLDGGSGLGICASLQSESEKINTQANSLGEECISLY